MTPRPGATGLTPPSVTPRDVRVKIDLPLPLDMVSTIGNLLALAYPGAAIDFGDGYGRQLVIRVPDGERRHPKKVGKRAASEAIVDADEDGLDGSLAGMDADGTLRIIPPEELALTLAASFRAIFEDNPAAENYLEWTVHDREDVRKTWVVIVCKSDEQTPHALRRKAEDERDAALARLAELEATADA